METFKNDKNGEFRAIYKPGELHLQSYTYLDPSGVERVAYSGKTVDEYMADKAGQGFELVPLDVAQAMADAARVARYCKPWREITEKEWWYHLEILPPEKWRAVRGVEIFRMSEYMTGNLTDHFARLGKRYFQACRDASLDYNDIAAEIAAIVAERGAA